MATLTTQVVTDSGTQVTYQAAAGGGDKLTFADDVALHVKNGGGSPITVTVVAQTPCNQGFLHDQTVSVTNGTDKFIGNFNSRFLDGSGFVSFTYSAVTSVTIAAIKS